MEVKINNKFMNNSKIIVISKNKKSIEKFMNFFSKNNTIHKYLPRKNKRQILTILKSPHINKKAQEQFESKIYSKQIDCSLIDNVDQLIFTKKIKNALFSDIQVKIKNTNNKTFIKKNKNFTFCPKNFDLEIYFKYENKNAALQYLKKNKTIKTNIEKIKNLIKIYNVYGEF